MDSGVVQIVTTGMWIAAIAGAGFVLRRPIRELLLPRLSSVNAFGVRVEFAEGAMESAVASYEERGGTAGVVSPGQQSIVLQRAVASSDLLAGTRLLWVDDEPRSVSGERRLLRSLGVEVETARSAGEGARMVESGDFDLVISDLKQAGGSGLDIVPALKAAAPAPCLILYIGRVDRERPIPPGAFAIVDRPDELLHAVLDALARRERCGP